MNEGQRITDRPLLENIPEGSSYLVEAGDGSGTKRVTHEKLVEAITKVLPIGDLEDVGTEETGTVAEVLAEIFVKATAKFTGTDGVKPGNAGIVPAPQPGDDGKVLGANGKWVPAGSGGGDIDAGSVKFEDGKTAEEKLGMIDGATDDLNCENDRMVAKMTAVKKLNDGLKIGGVSFIVDPETGKITGYKTKVGADTEFPFSGGSIAPLIPKMISPTETESGEFVGTVICESEESGSEAWKAFDKGDVIGNNSVNPSRFTTSWRANHNNTWIGYHFNEPKVVQLMSYTANTDGNSYRLPRKVKFQANNDGENTWYTLASCDLPTSAGCTTILVPEGIYAGNPYTYYRLLIEEISHTGVGISQIQMYGH